MLSNIYILAVEIRQMHCMFDTCWISCIYWWYYYQCFCSFSCFAVSESMCVCLCVCDVMLPTTERVQRRWSKALHFLHITFESTSVQNIEYSFIDKVPNSKRQTIQLTKTIIRNNNDHKSHRIENVKNNGWCAKAKSSRSECTKNHISIKSVAYDINGITSIIPVAPIRNKFQFDLYCFKIITDQKQVIKISIDLNCHLVFKIRQLN